MNPVVLLLLFSGFPVFGNEFHKDCMDLSRKARDSLNVKKGCQLRVKKGQLSSTDPIREFGGLLPEILQMDRHMNYTEICKFLQNTSIVCRGNPAGSRFILSPYLSAFIRNIISFRNNSCRDQGGLYDSALGICFREFKKTDHQPMDFAISDAFYITGLIVNPISLLFVIFVYSYFEELRTVPGKNILYLASMFLFSEILEIVLFSTSGKPEILCQAVAILRHWSMLSVFFCMAAISFDLYTTFKSLRNCLESSRTFLYYLRFMLLSPSLIVLVCIVLEYGTTVHIGYGKFGQDCFVTGLLAIIIAFFVPVLVIFVVNVGLMTVTIYRIRRHQKETTKVLKHGSLKRNATLRWPIVALKLSTVLGIGWMCGFLGSFFHLQALRYIYHFFINFFGVFLIFSFLATHRVYTLLKDKMRRKPQRTSFSGMVLTNSSAGCEKR